MSLINHKTEHIRHMSLVAYIVMLALFIPLTVLALQKEQEVRTRAQTTKIIVTPTITPEVPAQ